MSKHMSLSIVVWVSAFVMVSIQFGQLVSCLLFFYPRCPLQCPYGVGATGIRNVICSCGAESGASVAAAAATLAVLFAGESTLCPHAPLASAAVRVLQGSQYCVAVAVWSVLTAYVTQRAQQFGTSPQEGLF